MGIGTSLITKIGIPVGILVLGGVLLAKFKEPILERAGAAGASLGQIAVKPFEGLIEGIGQGFSNITFPDFNFSQTPIETRPLDTVGNPASNPQFPTEVDVALSKGEKPPVDPVDPNGGNIVGDQGKFLPPTDPAKTFEIITSSIATPQRLTKSELEEQLGAPVVGIFDLANTPFIERVPLTKVSFDAFRDMGVGLRLQQGV